MTDSLEFDPDRPWCLLTNRYNLLEILSSGLAKPVEGYGKYYEDLSRLTPGHIPILRAPVGQDVQSMVGSSSPSGFPVLLELREALGGDVATEAYLLSRPLYLGEFSAVHFRTEEELDEHRIREYEGIDHSSLPYVVSPDLFAGKEQTVLPEVSGSPMNGPDEFRLADKIAGALSFGWTAVGSDESLWRTYALLANELANHRDIGKAWERSLATYDRDGECDPFDKELLTVLCEALASIDGAGGVSGSALLRSLNDPADARLPGFDRWEPFYLRVMDLLRSKLSLDQVWGEFASDIERGAAAFLLAPDPRRLAALSKPKGLSSFVSRVLSGFMAGLANLSLEHRAPAGLTDHILRLEVGVITGSVVSPLSVTAESIPPLSGRVKLRSDDHDLISTELPLAACLARANLTQELPKRAVFDLSKRMSWDCVDSKIIQPFGEYTVRISHDGVVTEAKGVDLEGQVRIVRSINEPRLRELLATQPIPRSVEQAVLASIDQTSEPSEKKAARQRKRKPS